MKFKEIKSKPDFPKLEEKIIRFWKENDTLKKYLKKNESSPKRFSFLDGPITANNPMGVHHAWGRSLKDLYQRYKNMQGFKQRFQNGFDNQGLWVEVEVEKKLGFQSKKDIENYGIADFVEKCKEHTQYFAEVQTEQSKRLGYFMDWENSYYTMSEENNYAIWHFLKKCWQSNWLYKGEDVVPWCPRCGTAISQHEILTGDYAELTHKAVYVKYPLVGKEQGANGKEYLLVWTTTPWTLLANVAIAFNPDIEYIRVKNAEGQILILAKARISVVGQDYEILEELPGKDLEGLKYRGAFDELPIVKKNIKEHKVVSWKDGVSDQEGTGLVHVSTGSGPEDYDLGKKIGLPVFPVLDEMGFYIEGYGAWTKRNAKDVAQDIFKSLEDKGNLYKTEDFLHRYPLCWRCKKELLFRLVDEWYVSMKELRPKMIEVAKKIRWIPEFGLKMELDWLTNMEDWLISKKRYWGLALPIFECECGHFVVVGSKEELKEKAVEGWSSFESRSPHRPWVDAVKISCPKCGKSVSRISDVGNPWLDAGIVPFSTTRYFEDKEYWKKWFPADLVLECFPGQFKNWFYSLIAMATVLEDTNPFKTLIGHALVRDEYGQEMHKSLGNAIEFNEAAEKMGADVMRWMFGRQNLRININFGYGPAEEVKKRFLFILWNCYKFFLDYAVVDIQSTRELTQMTTRINSKELSALDKWIVSRLNGLVELVSKKLDDFDHPSAFSAIENFVVNDFSTWYIRRSRDRIGPSAPAGKDKEVCYFTFYKVLTTLNKLLAPLVPFLAEELWQSMQLQSGGADSPDSVHLQDWPAFEEDLISQELEEKMELVRKLCGLGNAARKEALIKIRQPLATLQIELRQRAKIDSQLLDLIKKELNVRNILFVAKVSDGKNWLKKEQEDLEIALNTFITLELKEEGQVRETIRQIQAMRKKAGLKPKDEILIYCSGTEEIAKILEKNRKLILSETRTKNFIFKEKERPVFEIEKELKIEDQSLIIGIKKVS